ncbi:MAG TPA: TrkA C-terminal domain-containing protein, partial [Caldisericia bacterium]|nr:TrkA C-terminal domain-containing protein [Caldisericia bacterium]
NFPSVGKKLSEIKFPKESLIISIIRNDETIIPYGEITINNDDILYVITKKDKSDRIRNILLGEENKDR